MSLENDKIIKEKLIEALSIIDNDGRLNYEGGYVLWPEKWMRLRHLIYVCFEIVDKLVLDELLEG